MQRSDKEEKTSLVRIVLDTNILISALISPGATPDLLIHYWESGAFTLVTSHPQLDELSRVLAYEKLAPFLRPFQSQRLLERIAHAAAIASDLPKLTVSPDPDDNAIIATAIAGKADLIVTGDKRGLLALGSVQGIPIVTAREAVERLGAREGDKI